MECPECHCKWPSRECPECGEEIPVFGRYCCYCGSALPDVTQASPEPEEEEMDFSGRILCSDGNCIGVINKDGICKECGKPYTGETE